MTAPAIAITWRDVHVGDVALGKDGAGWQVRSREPGERWVGAGQNDIYTLRSVRDGREVKAGMQLHHPVTLVERADHSEMAESVDALLGAGFTVQILREASMSDTPDQHETGGVETFGGPAPDPAGVAPETDAQRCARGEHPEQDRSVLKDGRVFCTRCMVTVGDALDPVANAGLAVAAGLPVPPGLCADSTGVEYNVPGDQVAQACAAGLHPVALRQWSGEAITGCGACGLVMPAPTTVDVPGAPQAVTPAPDGGNGGGALVTGPSAAPTPEPCAHPGDALRAIIDGSTWCSQCKETVFASGGNAAVAAPADQFADPTPRREAPKGRWGWYKLPHPVTGEVDKVWPRVSTVAKTLADETGITTWKLRNAVKGVSTRPDLIAVAAALDIDMDKSKLDEVVKSAMEAAQTQKGANFGTALHKFAERLDDGEGIGSMSVPAALVADLEAYARTIKEHSLEVLPQYTERTIINATHEYAGTWDRIVRDKRTGAQYVLDLKTGQDLSYSWLEYGIQQAAYANGEHLCSRDFTRYEPMPDVDKMKALILHLPIGSARGEIYGLAIDKGWQSLLTSVDARRQRSEARKGWSWLVKPQSPADVIRLHLDRSETQDEFAAVAQNAITRGLWTDELAAYAVERFDIVRVRSSTYDGLATLWAELHPLGRWTEPVNAAALERATAVMPAPVAA